jgi:L-glyceraldehyde 3-phosphate reductase
MGALHTAVQQGKALYVGISSYGPERTRQAAAILRDLGTPLLIHQPSYSMVNRWVEHGLLDVLAEVGAGCIAFTALAQGLLTGKYLDGVPQGSRAAGQGATLSSALLTDQRINALRELNRIATARGQSLAQMALSWVLRDQRMTSVVVGASSVQQLEDNVAAIGHTDFSPDELAAVDAVATDDPDIDLWRAQSMVGAGSSR